MNMTYRTSKKAFVYFLLFIVMLLVVTPVYAGPVFRSGESVSVEADQVVEGDLYAAGGTVTISGNTEGDVFAAGGTVKLNAPVSEDVVIAGGAVQIDAPVNDDLRIAGGEVVVADVVEGDLVVLGGAVQVLSTAVVKGDLLFAAGTIEVRGPVEGSVFGIGDRVRIDATVGGTLTVRAEQNLTLGDRAEVLGDIVYKGRNEIARAQGAVVVGDIQTELLPMDTSAAAEAAIIGLLVVLFGALTILLVFKPFLVDVVDRTKESYGVNGLIGLGVFIGIPFVSLLLMFSILGLIVGLILFMSYIGLLLLSWVMVGPVIGSIIMQRFKKERSVTILSVVLGVLLFELIIFVPFIGLLVAFALYVIVLGTIVERAYTAIR